MKVKLGSGGTAVNVTLVQALIVRRDEKERQRQRQRQMQNEEADTDANTTEAKARILSRAATANVS